MWNARTDQTTWRYSLPSPWKSFCTFTLADGVIEKPALSLKMGFKRLIYIAAAVILVLGTGVWLEYLPLWSILAALIIIIGIIAAGAARIGSGLFIPAIVNYPTAEKKIALTFDDGPHPLYTLATAELMERYQGRATYFCIGYRLKQHPSIAYELHNRGHQIANHSYTHAKWIDFKSKRGWMVEISKTDEAILSITKTGTTLFRPPYGVTTPHLAAAIRESGHQVIGWNIRPFDTSEINPDEIVKRVISTVKAGDIILLHDTHDRILPALERLLPRLVENGYQLVTIEELTYNA